MSTKHSTTTEHERAHEATLDTLRKAFERYVPGFRPTEQGTRATLTASINHLVKLAGIEKGKQTRAELYDEAVRALAGQRPPGSIEYVQHLCERIRQEWECHPLSPNRVNRLKQKWYKTATTLRRAFDADSSEYEVTTDEERGEIVGELNDLAEEAGIARSEGYMEMDFEMRYIEAIKELGGTDKGSPHGARVTALTEAIQERDREYWRQKREAEAGRRSIIASRPRRSEPYGARGVAIIITRDCLRCVGLVRGDEVRARTARDLKPGDVAALREGEGKDLLLGRVVAVAQTHITLKDDEGEFTREHTALTWTGRVDHKNPTKADPLSEEDRERVDELRGKLDRLDREDDQIIRCTVRYKLEREIYDIEHPPADSDDWSEWEGDDAE